MPVADQQAPSRPAAPLIIRPSASAARKIVYGELVFVGLCVALVVGGIWNTDPLAITLGLAMGLVSIILLAKDGGRLRRREALLVVDTSGLTHPDFGFIPWADVASVSMHEGPCWDSNIVGVTWGVYVSTNRSDEYRESLTSKAARSFYWGQKGSEELFKLEFDVLPMEMDDLIRAMEERAGRSLRIEVPRL